MCAGYVRSRSFVFFLCERLRTYPCFAGASIRAIVSQRFFFNETLTGPTNE